MAESLFCKPLVIFHPGSRSFRLLHPVSIAVKDAKAAFDPVAVRAYRTCGAGLPQATGLWRTTKQQNRSITIDAKPQSPPQDSVGGGLQALLA